MKLFDEIFERIKLATNTRTQVELADVLDIRQSSISDAKRRNSVPSDWYMKLFEQFGLNPDWLKKGSGPMYLRTDQGYAPVDAPASIGVCEDAAKFSGPDAKNLIVSVYATQQHDDQSGQVLGRLSIPQSFACPGLHVVRIDAAGMEPLIRKDAFAGIDTTQKKVRSGELYAVNIPYEGLVIKRAYVDAQNNRLILRSENQQHPEMLLPLDDHEKHVAGRLVWIMQRM
ncbi:helix-turn-helix domain-containing protein [Desulfovibrio sp. OttesenSCG-928-A18]|nr:helix-turn-helix domain-containing protein [Desulfovibrio sp. OttesenSCG-928-A18]